MTRYTWLYTTRPIASKWQSLDEKSQLSLITDFLSTEQQQCVTETKQLLELIKVPLPDGFVLPRRYEQALTDYLAKALRSHRGLSDELSICKAWAESTSFAFELERLCSVGRIDIVLKHVQKELYLEGKVADSWKHALGQILAYSYVDKPYAMALLLIGNRPNFDYQLIESCCKSYGVCVFWAKSIRDTCSDNDLLSLKCLFSID